MYHEKFLRLNFVAQKNEEMKLSEARVVYNSDEIED